MEPSDGPLEVWPGAHLQSSWVHLDDAAPVQPVSRPVSEAASARRVQPVCACHWACHRGGSAPPDDRVVVRPRCCRHVGSVCRLAQGCCRYVLQVPHRFGSVHRGDRDGLEHQGVLSQLLQGVLGLQVARTIQVFGRRVQHQCRQVAAVAVCQRVLDAASDA